MSVRMDRFIPARTRIGAGFLERYLPSMAENVAAAYVEATSSTGDLILDPFCQSAATVVGAVSRGRRILACSFNPVEVLSVREILSPLPARQLDAATTRLAESPRGGSALREHILRLYRCACPSCRRMAIADYFVWDMAKVAPIEKYVRCPECGFEGASVVQAEDLSVLEQVEDRGLAYFFVLDRLAPIGDAARQDSDRLLALYSPRARYALTHMVMNTEAEFANTREEDALKYLLVACLVRGALFNRPPLPDDTATQRRGNLGLERNIWLVFEEAWKELRTQSDLHAVLKLHPFRGIDALNEVVQDSGEHNAAVVCCGVRDLARALPLQSVQSIVTRLFSANQRYWRLSFLWSGWLLGRDQASALRPLISQSTPDWSWYTRTLSATFRALRSKLRPSGNLATIVTSRRSNQAEAVLLAAAASRLKPVSYTYGASTVADTVHGTGDYQLLFVKGGEALEGVGRPPDRNLLARELKQEIGKGALDTLHARGEPLAIGWLRNGAFARLSQRGSLERTMLYPEEEFSGYEFVQKQFDEALGAEGRGLLAPMEWEASFAANATIPMLWPREPQQMPAPLGDRVEEAAISILGGSLLIRREDYEQAMYDQFPSLQTPEGDLVEACLLSYGEETSPGYWRLRADDDPAHVDARRARLVADLEALGRRVGVGTTQDAAPHDLVWQVAGPVCAFLFSPTAVLGALARLPPLDPDMPRYLVVPEARVPLLRLKLHRSPIYGRILQQGSWSIVRQPFVGQLLKAPQVDIHSLKQVVGLDPIIEKGEAQIPLF